MITGTTTVTAGTGDGIKTDIAETATRDGTAETMIAGNGGDAEMMMMIGTTGIAIAEWFIIRNRYIIRSRYIIPRWWLGGRE